jgi:hypothetical protein
MKVYQQGECAEAYAVNLNHAGTATDADSAVYSLTDPDDSLVVTSQAMNKILTGEYIYDYDIPANGKKGIYKGTSIFTTGGHKTIVYSSFKVI